MEAKCTAFKKSVTNDPGSTRFLCPHCAKHEIVRSKKARELSTKYVCSSCGFEGPN